ncbi:hypothetical protein Y032_0139g2093 [Ancylostoma ceylanicum]|uniref:Uncharacterized protein n=1 Tax=Ancylostoma ceylanicum TaxID=53326 RepID=A0A016T4M2_9BILA|nr:hypothetical protein Y032_0139g2093 [Ancylostoma ceylanicum]
MVYNATLREKDRVRCLKKGCVDPNGDVVGVLRGGVSAPPRSHSTRLGPLPPDRRHQLLGSSAGTLTSMVALRNFRHQIADSVRRLLRSPRHSPTKLFFRRKAGYSSELSTPNSTRSVSFTEALSWPFIDDDVPEE